MGLDIILGADPSSTALIVIDMQVDFLSPQGRLPIDRARIDDLIAHVNAAIVLSQARGVLVVHAGNEFPRLSVANVFRKFAAIDPRVRREGTRYISKRHGDAFTNPELSALLSRSAIQTVLISGQQ